MPAPRPRHCPVTPAPVRRVRLLIEGGARAEGGRRRGDVRQPRHLLRQHDFEFAPKGEERLRTRPRQIGFEATDAPRTRRGRVLSRFPHQHTGSGPQLRQLPHVRRDAARGRAGRGVRGGDHVLPRLAPRHAPRHDALPRRAGRHMGGTALARVRNGRGRAPGAPRTTGIEETDAPRARPQLFPPGRHARARVRLGFPQPRQARVQFWGKQNTKKEWQGSWGNVNIAVTGDGGAGKNAKQTDPVVGGICCACGGGGRIPRDMPVLDRQLLPNSPAALERLLKKTRSLQSPSRTSRGARSGGTGHARATPGPAPCSPWGTEQRAQLARDGQSATESDGKYRNWGGASGGRVLSRECGGSESLLICGRQATARLASAGGRAQKASADGPQLTHCREDSSSLPYARGLLWLSEAWS
eukprot:gene19041-biopygen22010